MTRWLLLCAACLAVYWLPVLFGPAGGAWFFAANASWSFALCAMALLIAGSRTALVIAILECMAIALNLICLWQYMTVTGFFYGIYGGVIDAIVIAEIIALTMGAPWDGIRRMVHERWGSVDYRSPAYMRRGLDSREGQA